MCVCPEELVVFACLVRCRLISQCAVQPGLGKVYSQILLQTHTSAEFYLKVSASSPSFTWTHDSELALKQQAPLNCLLAPFIFFRGLKHSCSGW